MSTTDILREAEADLAALTSLPGAIRDKVKAGVAELRRIHDAIDAELARITDAAKSTLASLQAAPAAEGRTSGEVPQPDAAAPGSFGG